MKAQTFSQVCEQLSRMTPQERVTACLGLAEAAGQGAADEAAGSALVVFDPQECGPDDAGRCEFFGRPVQHEQRVCAVAVTDAVGCPLPRP